MTDDRSNGKKGKGFAGLNSMVSDVSEDVEKAANAAPPKTTSPVAPPSEPSPPTGSGKSGLGWVIAVVVVLVIWIANSGSGNKRQPIPSYSPLPSYSVPAPVAAPAPAPAPVQVSDEQKPPVGRNNVLNIPQIRWCKREKIRIEAIESVINNTYEHEVDLFNAKVADYNSHCGEFRYRRGDVEQVDRELASERESIRSETKSEWVRSSLGLMERSAAAPTKAKPPSLNTQLAACQNDFQCPDSQYCFREKCIGNNGSASSLSPPSTSASAEMGKTKLSMPVNAELDYSGHDWRCKQGYRKSGNECGAVQIPANGELDYSGHDWRCQQGFRKSGNNCMLVTMPPNAELDYSGHDWRCIQGYQKAGNECRPL